MTSVSENLNLLRDKNIVFSPTFQSNSSGKLRYAMSFLPVARSSATLDYFYTLRRDSMVYNNNHENPEAVVISDGRTQVVAMDLGLKSSLFDRYLIQDAAYLGIGLTFISLTILSYTRSLFLTVTGLLAIVFSLNLAYFIYTFVFRISFFPFMNVLASVIAIGVGADDTFILVKAWNSQLIQAEVVGDLNDKQMTKLVKSALKHSVLTMLVTSATTCVAFLASLISNVTAIKCFR